MQSILLRTTLIISLGWASLLGLYAQSGSGASDQGLPQEATQSSPKIRFNGLGRSHLLNTQLGGTISETDTTNGKRISDGEFLLDLAVNATPNSKTEVQTILRLRNEFGGFFGAGMSVEVRELWARGIIGNAVRYHVGDIDLVQTPYTLFNPDEEGTINEAEIFKGQRDIIHYENFYKDGNKRRLQGAKIDFGLTFTRLIDELEVEAYLTRVRGTDFFNVPNRFVAGGKATFIENTYGQIGLNYINTFDDLSVGAISTGIRNSVYTIDGEINVLDNDAMKVQLAGEAGMSSLLQEVDSVNVLDKSDGFAEIGASLNLKSANLVIDLGFRDVGPDFFSVAAQSKRVDFTRDKRYFNRIGNERFIRNPSTFDLGRDPSLYTFQLSDQLMAYDMRLSNVLPYGKATPNRRGLIAGIQYGDSTSAVELDVDAAFLSEIRGQGTNELKDFSLVRAAADVHLSNMFSWKKEWVVTLGLQLEQTTRGGEPVEMVDLSSTLFEAGVEAELFDSFDILLGGKFLNSVGSDYMPLYEAFNIVLDFPGRLEVDDSEALLAGGFRYRFKDGIFVTAQYQNFSFSRATSPDNAYDISQFFVLYTMNF